MSDESGIGLCSGKTLEWFGTCFISDLVRVGCGPEQSDHAFCGRRRHGHGLVGSLTPHAWKLCCPWSCLYHFGAHAWWVFAFPSLRVLRVKPPLCHPAYLLGCRQVMRRRWRPAIGACYVTFNDHESSHTHSSRYRRLNTTIRHLAGTTLVELSFVIFVLSTNSEYHVRSHLSGFDDTCQLRYRRPSWQSCERVVQVSKRR